LFRDIWALRLVDRRRRPVRNGAQVERGKPVDDRLCAFLLVHVASAIRAGLRRVVDVGSQLPLASERALGPWRDLQNEPSLTMGDVERPIPPFDDRILHSRDRVVG
jgi:hypothetical protein